MVDIVIKLGWQHNKWVIVIRDYGGPMVIGPALMHAINNHMCQKHGVNNYCQDYDHIEILGYERRDRYAIRAT